MLEHEREVALRAVHAAARVCRVVQSEIVPGHWNKDDRSPVTVADLAAQAVISGILLEQFPNDPLMGEEGSEELRVPERKELLDQVVQHVQYGRPELPATELILDWIERGQKAIDTKGRYWVLDPVDGTKGFLRKEQYAIALALIENGKILLGVLGCPNMPQSLADPADATKPLGQMYVAVRGEGAESIDLVDSQTVTMHGPRLQVSDSSDPAAARWCERVESSSRNKDMTGLVVEQVGITQPPYRIDSQAKYAVVARGEASLYLRHTLDPSYREKVWDHAAGVLVIEEAGGKVTDLWGRPLDFSRGRELSNNRGIVATNGLLHDRVLAAVRNVLPKSEAPPT